MKNFSVLVVDDEYKINEAVSTYLKSKNYTVYSSETGGGALRILADNRVDIIILDLMLPDISGEEVCKRIRKNSNVPVIMLTAKVQEESVVNGLKIGADDYVAKPFSLKQLAARVDAVLRRTGEAKRDIYCWKGGLTADFQAMEVCKNGAPVALTASEWKIFSALANQPNVVFTREKLIDVAFDGDFDSYDRAIDTHIKNLRKKIETDTKNPQYILTVRGSGYKFGGTN